MSQRGKSHREAALSALHGDPFHFGHFFHREAAALASKAAVLDAAERNMGSIRNGAVIEMGHARFQSEGEVERLLHIVGDDARRKALIRVVFECFVAAFDARLNRWRSYMDIKAAAAGCSRETGLGLLARPRRRRLLRALAGCEFRHNFQHDRESAWAECN